MLNYYNPSLLEFTLTLTSLQGQCLLPTLQSAMHLTFCQYLICKSGSKGGSPERAKRLILRRLLGTKANADDDG